MNKNSQEVLKTKCGKADITLWTLHRFYVKHPYYKGSILTVRY